MRNRKQLSRLIIESRFRSTPKATVASVLTAVALSTLTLLPSAPAQAAVTPATSVVLPNGVTVVTRRDRLAPRIAISVLVRAGAADETAESAGWRRLLTDAMLRASLQSTPAAAKTTASEDKTAPESKATPETKAAGESTPAARGIGELQREAEKWGGRLGASVGDDYIEFWAVGDSTASRQLLDLLLSLALRPRLADEDIDAARRRLLARLESANENIALRATNALASQLYLDARGEPLAYGLPTNGTFKSLTALTGDKVRRLYDHFFAPARLIISASGDITAAELRPMLEKPAASAGWGQLSAWNGAAKPITYAKAPLFAAPNKNQPPLTVRQMNTPTAWVFVAYATAGMGSGDYIALRVLSAAMGESSRARLPLRLMGSRSGAPSARNPAETTTSQVAVQITPRRFAGELILFAQTSPQNVDDVKNAMLDEVRKLKDQPLSRAELESARNFVSGNWAVERENMRERAFQTGLAAVMNATADTNWPALVEGVSAAEVQRVAKKYLNNYAVALIMPQD